MKMSSAAILERQLRITQMTYEPVHEISNNVVCAISKASVQPAHTQQSYQSLC